MGRGVPSGRPSIGPRFHARVERYLKDHPELGYKNTSELIKELLRGWLREQAVDVPLDEPDGSGDD